MKAIRTVAFAIVASATLAIAQNANIAYNGSQITVQAINQYEDTALIGAHIGAGLSWMVAKNGSGNSFAFNTSATSQQLLNNDIAAAYSFPCYIVNDTSISSNAGPMACGVGDEDSQNYDVVDIETGDDGSTAEIKFEGINKWYICTVQTSNYGWYNDTVVGSFGTGVPSGPGIQNCTSIDGIAFASSNSMMPSNMTAPSNYSMTISSPSMTQSRDGFSTVTTTVPCTTSSVVPMPNISTPPYSNSTPSASPSMSSTPYPPIATYTGAASTNDAFALIGLVLAILAFQL